jgi:hypothetical protein
MKRTNNDLWGRYCMADGFTPYEQRVMHLLSTGATYEAIGETMGTTKHGIIQQARNLRRIIEQKEARKKELIESEWKRK